MQKISSFRNESIGFSVQKLKLNEMKMNFEEFKLLPIKLLVNVNLHNSKMSPHLKVAASKYHRKQHVFEHVNFFVLLVDRQTM